MAMISSALHCQVRSLRTARGLQRMEIGDLNWRRVSAPALQTTLKQRKRCFALHCGTASNHCLAFAGLAEAHRRYQKPHQRAPPFEV